MCCTDSQAKAKNRKSGGQVIGLGTLPIYFVSRCRMPYVHKSHYALAVTQRQAIGLGTLPIYIACRCGNTSMYMCGPNIPHSHLLPQCPAFIYRSLAKERPWVEHLASPPKRVVGALSNVSAFNSVQRSHQRLQRPGLTAQQHYERHQVTLSMA